MNKKEQEALAGVLAAAERVCAVLERLAGQARKAASMYAALLSEPGEKNSGKSAK